MADHYLTTLEKALRAGYVMHVFRSGGGLRVVSFGREGEHEVAYGEHPNLEDAFAHAAEDYLAGGRLYDEVYGTLRPHYLTGSITPSSELDRWVLGGRTIDAFERDGAIVCEMHGSSETAMPEGLHQRVIETGTPEYWEARGYRFYSRRSRFPNGALCVSTDVVGRPEKAAGAAWHYRVVKTGTAPTLQEALTRALEAQEVEVG